jgi:hypothetical protein
LAGLLALHQNYWMWADTRLVFGLPVNLLFHLVLCLVMPALMGVILRPRRSAGGE